MRQAKHMPAVRRAAARLARLRQFAASRQHAARDGPTLPRAQQFRHAARAGPQSRHERRPSGVLRPPAGNVNFAYLKPDAAGAVSQGEDGHGGTANDRRRSRTKRLTVPGVNASGYQQVTAASRRLSVRIACNGNRRLRRSCAWRRAPDVATRMDFPPMSPITGRIGRAACPTMCRRVRARRATAIRRPRSSRSGSTTAGGWRPGRSAAAGVPDRAARAGRALPRRLSRRRSTAPDAQVASGCARPRPRRTLRKPAPQPSRRTIQRGAKAGSY